MSNRVVWIGMLVFTVIFGGFLGSVLSKGDLLWGAIGAVVLSVIGIIYLVTLGTTRE